MGVGKNAAKVQVELTMDMTPMIDCVFLLMIFFVLVIDLSQQTLEDLILPKAKYAVPDEKPPQNRPVVNIMQDGRVVVKKNTRYNPAEHGDNFSTIHALLLEMKNTIEGLDIETKKVGGTSMTLINDPLLIRADKWTEWHYVGKFMEACVFPQAAFWKIELALSEQDKEAKMLVYGEVAMSKLTDQVQEEVKPDMTPMIDCVFLLIIFFLCIDFKVLESKLPAYLPKDSGSQKTKEEPIEKLSLQIECLAVGTERPRPQGKSIYREGHRVRYKVATVSCDTDDALLRELERVIRDKSKWQKDDKGVPKPPPIVIEPGVSAVYGDVAAAVDAAKKAGYEDIQFGGGMGSGKKKPAGAK